MYNLYLFETGNCYSLKTNEAIVNQIIDFPPYNSVCKPRMLNVPRFQSSEALSYDCFRQKMYADKKIC